MADGTKNSKKGMIPSSKDTQITVRSLCLVSSSVFVFKGKVKITQELGSVPKC